LRNRCSSEMHEQCARKLKTLCNNQQAMWSINHHP
jgi:hypothetical protein